MDTGTRQAKVHGVAKSTTEHTLTHTHTEEMVQFCISGGMLLMINLYGFRKALT